MRSEEVEESVEMGLVGSIQRGLQRRKQQQTVATYEYEAAHKTAENDDRRCNGIRNNGKEDSRGKHDHGDNGDCGCYKRHCDEYSSSKNTESTPSTTSSATVISVTLLTGENIAM